MKTEIKNDLKSFMAQRHYVCNAMLYLHHICLRTVTPEMEDDIQIYLRQTSVPCEAVRLLKPAFEDYKKHRDQKSILFDDLSRYDGRAKFRPRPYIQDNAAPTGKLRSILRPLERLRKLLP